MDLAVVVLALGLCYFVISVGLDPKKTKLQQTMSALVAIVGAFVIISVIYF